MQPVPERFWVMVNQTGGGDYCWPWMGAVLSHRGGYGSVAWGKRHWRAHRLAYMLATGVDPAALCVLHSCDNPPCCNPTHLFLGTRADNSNDMKLKGRSATGNRNGQRTHPASRHFGDRNGMRKHPERVTRGSCHPLSKLTEAEVTVIRRRARDGESGVAIARDFPLSPRSIRKIIAGDRWRHVGGAVSRRAEGQCVRCGAAYSVGQPWQRFCSVVCNKAQWHAAHPKLRTRVSN